MPDVVLDPSETIKEVISISNMSGCTVELVTLRKSLTFNPLTIIMKHLPEKIHSHCIRVAAISQILAEQAEDLPEGMNKDAFIHCVWMGGLYHHIGGFTGLKNKKQAVLAVGILKENLTYLSCCDLEQKMVLSIASQYGERFDSSGYPNKLQGKEVLFAARIIAFVNLLDGFIIYKEACSERNIEKTDRYMRKKGAAIFGSDVMACFEKSRDIIFDLYRRRYQRVQGVV